MNNQCFRFSGMPLLLAGIWLATIACSRSNNADNATTPPADTLKQTAQPLSPPIGEASAMSSSKKYNTHLWVLEDSGNPPALILLGQNGAWRHKLFLKGATNRDWEAMAMLRDTIFIGDIGDNAARFNQYFIHYLAEPDSTTDTTTNFNSLTFAYPDGAHDAEAMLADDSSGAIYIITKRDAVSGIYKLSPPFSANMTATYVSALPYNGVVDAALSPDGKMILIKTYTAVRSYNRAAGESIATALSHEPQSLPYILEPQGEAITFRSDGKGYFTLSETVGTVAAQLYFYPVK